MILTFLHVIFDGRNQYLSDESGKNVFEFFLFPTNIWCPTFIDLCSLLAPCRALWLASPTPATVERGKLVLFLEQIFILLFHPSYL